MMKVPPLIINLKRIETHEKHDKHEKHGKHDKHDKHERHEKHDKHKKHRKHKKHKKHKHKHHHQDEPRDKPQIVTTLNPPVLEPVELAEQESSHFQDQQYYPDAVPDDYRQHPVPTPPSEPKKHDEHVEESEPMVVEESQLVQDEPTTSTPLLAPASGSTATSTEPPIEASSEPTNGITSGSATEFANESLAESTNGSVTANAVGALDETSIADTVTKPGDAVGSQTEPSTELATIENQARREPTSKLSFLRLAEDGSVRMTIIGPKRDPENDSERVINLEQVCGQLQEGLDVIPSDIQEEDIKEQVKVNPVEIVEQTVFGSHLPRKDSTFATLSGKESELLLEIYGDNPTCVDYADSIRSFVADTNYPMQMADSLLNLLTENKHKEVTEVQHELNELDELLLELRQIQERRLSASPAPIEPSEAESELADKILKKMTKLIKDKLKPGDISDSSSILKALGIGELA